MFQLWLNIDVLSVLHALKTDVVFVPSVLKTLNNNLLYSLLSGRYIRPRWRTLVTSLIQARSSFSWAQQPMWSQEVTEVTACHAWLSRSDIVQNLASLVTVIASNGCVSMVYPSSDIQYLVALLHHAGNVSVMARECNGWSRLWGHLLHSLVPSIEHTFQYNM